MGEPASHSCLLARALSNSLCAWANSALPREHDGRYSSSAISDILHHLFKLLLFFLVLQNRGRGCGSGGGGCSIISSLAVAIRHNTPLALALPDQAPCEPRLLLVLERHTQDQSVIGQKRWHGGFKSPPSPSRCLSLSSSPCTTITQLVLSQIPGSWYGGASLPLVSCAFFTP